MNSKWRQKTRVYAIAYVIAAYSELEDGMTVSEINAFMPCSQNTVRNCLERYAHKAGICELEEMWGTSGRLVYGFPTVELQDVALLTYRPYYDALVRGVVMP